MLAHVLHEWRPPRPERHHIEEEQFIVVAAVQKMRAENGRSAKIMRDRMRPVELPVAQQLFQEQSLHRERDILTFALFRLA
jgi:hypothetical protein